MAYIIRAAVAQIMRGLAYLFERPVPQVPVPQVPVPQVPECPPGAGKGKRKRDTKDDADEPESKRKKIEENVATIDMLVAYVDLKNLTLHTKLVKVKNLPPRKKFVMRMRVGHFRSFGIGTTKADAEEKAAKILLDKLRRQEIINTAASITDYAKNMASSANWNFWIFDWSF